MLEARFAEQLFELRVPLGRDGDALPSNTEIEAMFRSVYQSEYGFDLPDAQVQVVNLRVMAKIDLGHQGNAVFATAPSGTAFGVAPHRFTMLLQRDGSSRNVPVHRASGMAGLRCKGPAIIEHVGSTVWILEGQTAAMGANGEVTVRLSGGR